MMDFQEAQRLLLVYLNEFANQFQRLPGSAIFLRYVKSSYQNDPVRSAVELFLFLFAVRYLLAPKYSTKPGIVALSEEEIDDLVEDWTPEPLVGPPSALEETEVEKRAVIVGYVVNSDWSTPLNQDLLILYQPTDRRDRSRNCPMAARSPTLPRTTSTTSTRTRRSRRRRFRHCGAMALDPVVLLVSTVPKTSI